MNPPIQITLSRDTALMLAGWINAHRPPGDWEPPFVTAVLVAISAAVGEKEVDPGDET